MIKIKRDKLLTILLSFYLFLLIYNPPIIAHLSFTVLFSLISFIYTIYNYRLLIRIIYNTKLKKYILLIGIFFLYYILCCAFNSLILSEIYLVFNTFFFCLVNIIMLLSVSFALIIYCYKMGISVDMLLRCFIYAGLIQGVLGLMSFMFPSIKEIFTTLLINSTDSFKISRSLIYTSSYRYFGLTSSPYDIFGYSTSLLAIMSIYYSLYKNIKYLLIALIISFCAIINARTSIIILSVSIIVIFGKKLIRSKKNILNIAIFAVLIMVGMFIIVSIMKNGSNNSEWVTSGFNEIVSFFVSNENIGYFDTLINDFIFFPDSLISILLGTSLTPMLLVNTNTDIGFIQNIWSYGIIGSIILYGSFVYLFIIAYKNAKDLKKIIIVFGITTIIYMIKLNCVGYTQASVIFIPISIACIVLKTE